MQCYCKLYTLASVLSSNTLSFRSFWLSSRTQESSSFPALLASETQCPPQLPPAEISLWHSCGDSGQIGPTCYSSFLVRSMISWGSCCTPAWSCLVPELWDTCLVSKASHWLCAKHVISFSLLSPWPRQDPAAPTRFLQTPYAAGSCTTICQNPSLTWFPSSFLTLDF